MEVRPGWGTAYHRCPMCKRMIAGCYDDVLRAVSRAHRGRAEARAAQAAATPAATAAPAEQDEIARLKARLDRWLADADSRDPWRVLGLPPGSPLDQARSRFRALAREHHPDRGGDPEQMRKFIRAWHAIRGGPAGRARG